MSGTHWAVAEAWSFQIINFELPTFIQLNKHTWLRSSGGHKGYRDEVSAPEELYNLGWEADTPQLALRQIRQQESTPPAPHPPKKNNFKKHTEDLGELLKDCGTWAGLRRKVEVQ